MNAETIARERNGRRCGAGWMIRCVADGHDDQDASLSIRQQGDKVLAHCFGGCTQDAVIAGLKRLGLWPEREQPVRTPAERGDWARRQRELERVLPDARYWRRAAIAMAEEWLVNAKARLFDPTPIPEDLSRPVQLPGAGIYDAEQMLSRLRLMDGAALVEEYSWWLSNHPGFAWAMVKSARQQEQTHRAATLKYMEAAG